MKAQDSYHETMLLVRLLEGDLEDSEKAILTASESLIRFASIATERGNVLPEGGDKVSKKEAVLGSAETEIEGRHAKKNLASDFWHGFEEQPPSNYRSKSLDGEQWQLAWALGEVKILGGYSTKTLEGKLKSKLLWGKRSGRFHSVYLSTGLPEEKLSEALAELERIKERGPFHHPTHPLPKSYNLHQARPLKGDSRSILAQALYRVGVIKSDSVPALIQAIDKGGTAFGVYQNGKYLLYLHKRFTPKEVLRLHRVLEGQGSGPRASCN